MVKSRSIKSIKSCLLVLVFMSPLLMNPLHFMLVRHAERGVQKGVATVAAAENYCVYCEFKFSQFAELPDFKTIIREDVAIANSKISCVVRNSEAADSFTLYLGRAPPLFIPFG